MQAQLSGDKSPSILTLNHTPVCNTAFCKYLTTLGSLMVYKTILPIVASSLIFVSIYVKNVCIQFSINQHMNVFRIKLEKTLSCKGHKEKVVQLHFESYVYFSYLSRWGFDQTKSIYISADAFCISPTSGKK